MATSQKTLFSLNAVSPAQLPLLLLPMAAHAQSAPKLKTESRLRRDRGWLRLCGNGSCY